MPFLYFVSGIGLSSSVELATLTSATEPATVDIEFRVEALPPTVAAPSFLQRKTPGADRPFMSTARVPGGYLVDFGGQVQFWVRGDGGAIVAYQGNVAVDALEQLLMDQVLPQALQLRGQVSLHASSVALGSFAVAFLGPSGSGKSTLASALVPPGVLLGDDCLAVRRRGSEYVALPSYGSVRLRMDSANQIVSAAALAPASSRMTWKRRLPLPTAGAEVQLAAIYVLAEADSVRIESLTGTSSVAELLKQVHRLDPEDRALVALEFEVLTSLARSVRIYRLSYPRQFSALPEVARVTLDHARPLGLDANEPLT